MSEDIPKQFGRISLAMLGVGIGIGLAALFMWEWIDSVVLPDLDGVGRTVVTDVQPLILLSIAAVTAPIVAGLIGIFEGLRDNSVKQALIVGVAALVGAALLIVIAGIFISFTGGDDDNGAGPTFFDLVSLAGLGGIASFISAFVTTKFGAN